MLSSSRSMPMTSGSLSLSQSKTPNHRNRGGAVPAPVRPCRIWHRGLFGLHGRLTLCLRRLNRLSHWHKPNRHDLLVARLDNKLLRERLESTLAHLQRVPSFVHFDFDRLSVTRRCDRHFAAVNLNFGIRLVDLDHECSYRRLDLEDDAENDNGCHQEHHHCPNSPPQPTSLPDGSA